MVPVCYYEEGNNFWVSKMIKEGQRSTIVNVSWHPSMPLLATACTDYKVHCPDPPPPFHLAPEHAVARDRLH